MRILNLTHNGQINNLPESTLSATLLDNIIIFCFPDNRPKKFTQKMFLYQTLVTRCPQDCPNLSPSILCIYLEQGFHPKQDSHNMFLLADVFSFLCFHVTFTMSLTGCLQTTGWQHCWWHEEHRPKGGIPLVAWVSQLSHAKIRDLMLFRRRFTGKQL